MKNTLRIMFTLLFCIVICSFFASTAFADNVASGSCGEHLTWALDDKGTLTISGQGEMYELGVLYDGGVFLSDTPWYNYTSSVKKIIIGNGISSIASHAFKYCYNATEVSIPASVKTIGDSAFYQCYSLSKIDIPYGVTSIGTSAFDTCTGALSIHLPESLKTIGKMAFDDCDKVSSLVIPSSVESIGDYAFSNLWALKEVVVPSNIKTLSCSVFNNCHSLEKATISKGVETIGQYAFNADESLTAIIFEGSIPAIHEEAFRYVTSEVFYPKGDTSYTAETMKNYGGTLTWVPYVPENIIASGECGADGDNLIWTLSDSGLLTINGTGQMANYNIGTAPWYLYREAITSIVTEDGVNSIGQYAFMNCENLGTIFIPNSISSIGEFAFGQCPLLQSIIIPGSIAVVERYAFAGCTGLTQVTIEDGVAEIGYRAFRSCKSLESLSIPESVTSIGAEAFGQCDALANVAFSNGLITIEYEAFRDCVLLDNVDLPDSVTSIGYSAFQNCTALSRIKIPERLSRISHYAFYNCSNLAEINIPECITSIDDYAFVGCKSLTALSLPDSLLTLGQSAFLNCTGLEILVIPDAVSQISHSCLRGCSSLKAITIPSGITVIQPKAFDGCNRLEDVYYDGTEAQWLEISIGDDNTYLHQANRHYKYIAEGICGENLTWSLSGNGVLIISGVGDMPDNPYPWDDYKGSITEVVIESGITTIGNSAFYECRNLKNVTIPSSVTSIKPFAFGSCSNLTSITIPLSVENIGASAFYNCKGLEQVIILSALTDLEPGIFDYCDLLKTAGPIDSGCNIEFSWTEEIPDYAFYDCGSLTDVTIPNSVTRVGTAAFLECRNLENIILPVGTISIGDSAFYNCHALAQISIPSDVVYMGDYAFYGCNSISSITVPEGISSIGNYAFANCSSLASLTIPTSVSVIKMRAFSGCNNLTDVFYEGSRMDWGIIDVEVDNDLLVNATLHCAKYTIIFYGNGGTGTMVNQTLPSGTPTTLSANKYVRDGYVFKYWSTTLAGDGALYLDEETITLTQDTTLYAQWKKTAISSVLISGSITGSDQSAIWGETLTAVVNDDYFESGFNYAWKVGGDLKQQGSSNTYSVKQNDYGKQVICVVSHPQATNQPESNIKIVGTYVDGDDLMIINSGNVNYPYSKPASVYGVIPGSNFYKDGVEQIVPDSVTGGILAITEPGFYIFGNNSYTAENWFTVGYTISSVNGSGTITWKFDEKTLTTASRITEDGEVILLPYFGMLDGYNNTWIIKEGYGDDHIKCSIKPASGSHAYYSVNDGSYISTNGERTISLGTINMPMLYSIKFYKTAPSPITDAPLILPAALTEIGDEAFAGGAFTYVKLPEQSVSIGWRAFADCPNLSSIYIPAHTTQINEEAFGDKQALNIIGVPGSAAETFAIEHGFAFYLAA